MLFFNLIFGHLLICSNGNRNLNVHFVCPFYTGQSLDKLHKLPVVLQHSACRQGIFVE